MINTVYLLLGSNLGNRVEILSKVKLLINKLIGTIVNQSQLYESEAWGFVSGNFINQVLCVETEQAPPQILNIIHQIEAEAGRVRSNIGTYQARPLDIDILFYGNSLITSDDLVIPHPQLHNRMFTLLPLNEVAPSLVHPVLKLSINQLLEHCTDTVKVWIYKDE